MSEKKECFFENSSSSFFNSFIRVLKLFFFYNVNRYFFCNINSLEGYCCKLNAFNDFSEMNNYPNEILIE